MTEGAEPSFPQNDILKLHWLALDTTFDVLKRVPDENQNRVSNVKLTLVLLLRMFSRVHIFRQTHFTF